MRGDFRRGQNRTGARAIRLAGRVHTFDHQTECVRERLRIVSARSLGQLGEPCHQSLLVTKYELPGRMRGIRKFHGDIHERATPIVVDRGAHREVVEILLELLRRFTGMFGETPVHIAEELFVFLLEISHDQFVLR